MEFDLVPEAVIIIASGVIVFILGKNIPKLKDDASDSFWSGNYNEVEKREKEKFRYLYDRLAKKIRKEEYKKKMDLFWIWFEKLLRKARIGFLKVDNTIVMLLDRLRKKNIEKIEKIFRDDKEKNKNIAMAENAGISGDKDEPSEKARKFLWDDIKKGEGSVLAEKKAIKVEAASVEEKNNERRKSANAAHEADSDVINPEAMKESARIVSNTAEAVQNLGGEQKTNKEKEYIDMILKNPIDVRAYWHLGTIYSRRRNYKDAIECFRQITKIDPTYEKAKHKLSEIIEKMKKGVKRKGKGDLAEDENKKENKIN